MRLSSTSIPKEVSVKFLYHIRKLGSHLDYFRRVKIRIDVCAALGNDLGVEVPYCNAKLSLFLAEMDRGKLGPEVTANKGVNLEGTKCVISCGPG